jgi:hypothetical protein
VRFGMVLVLTLPSRSNTPATMVLLPHPMAFSLALLISLHDPHFSADERFVNFGVNAVLAKLYH